MIESILIADASIFAFFSLIEKNNKYVVKNGRSSISHRKSEFELRN